MIVEVAIKNEGIGSGERSTRPHQAIGLQVAFAVLIPDRVLIAKAEHVMHLLAVKL